MDIVKRFFYYTLSLLSWASNVCGRSCIETSKLGYGANYP